MTGMSIVGGQKQFAMAIEDDQQQSMGRLWQRRGVNVHGNQWGSQATRCCRCSRRVKVIASNNADLFALYACAQGLLN
jgi:hypothetical protein